MKIPTTQTVTLLVSLALLFSLPQNLMFCKDKTVYCASDFGIETVLSPVDYNSNGRDDYTDFLLGARKDAENHPTYDDRYFVGGYPPEDIGVCADVIWRAFREAGYSLRDMIDRDIERNPIKYSSIINPDTNIDFRRVVNLKVFFSMYAQVLTTDIDDISEWQPGDIVIFRNNEHIGIVSDKRNADGRPYIIHNGDQAEREEDYLGRDKVTAHYRFDASKVPNCVLSPWEP
jgi:uncharacterized protein YijF (DUF1287 family)